MYLYFWYNVLIQISRIGSRLSIAGLIHLERDVRNVRCVGLMKYATSARKSLLTAAPMSTSLLRAALCKSEFHDLLYIMFCCQLYWKPPSHLRAIFLLTWFIVCVIYLDMNIAYFNTANESPISLVNVIIPIKKKMKFICKVCLLTSPTNTQMYSNKPFKRLRLLTFPL